MIRNKITLQEYIESRNYKRKVQAKSRSKQKRQNSFIDPSSPKQSRLTEEVDIKNFQKLPKDVQIQEMQNEIKKIDHDTEVFSLIHKKIQQAKEYVRQLIENDKAFVTFSKMMNKIQSLYRQQLIEAYRYQLFKYQFSDEYKMDQNRKNILKQLNDNYMEAKFEYRRVILKEKVELTQSHKIILQNLLQNNTKKSRLNQSLIVGQSNSKQNESKCQDENAFGFLGKFISSTPKNKLQNQSHKINIVEPKIHINNCNIQQEFDEQEKIIKAYEQKKKIQFKNTQLQKYSNQIDSSSFNFFANKNSLQTGGQHSNPQIKIPRPSLKDNHKKASKQYEIPNINIIDAKAQSKNKNQPETINFLNFMLKSTVDQNNFQKTSLKQNYGAKNITISQLNQRNLPQEHILKKFKSKQSLRIDRK